MTSLFFQNILRKRKSLLLGERRGEPDVGKAFLFTVRRPRRYKIASRGRCRAEERVRPARRVRRYSAGRNWLATMPTPRHIRFRYPTDPLTEDVSIAAAARNQSILFNTRMLTIAITFLAILGAIPLLTTLIGPWINAPTTLTREQILLAISIAAAYVALSVLLLFMIISTFSAQRNFNARILHPVADTVQFKDLI